MLEPSLHRLLPLHRRLWGQIAAATSHTIAAAQRQVSHFQHHHDAVQARPGAQCPLQMLQTLGQNLQQAQSWLWSQKRRHRLPGGPQQARPRVQHDHWQQLQPAWPQREVQCGL